MQDAYNVHVEFSFENFGIKNVETGQIEQFLLPPSFMLPGPGGEQGYCGYLATTDACTHVKKLHELTRPSNESEFFGNKFNYKYSPLQLIEEKVVGIRPIMEQVRYIGVTDSDSYEAAPNVQGTREITGLPRLKIYDVKPFEKHWLDQAAVEKWAADIAVHMRHYGPLVGVFSCKDDVSALAQQFLYDPDPNTRYMITGTKARPRNVTHAVMLIGYGRATHIPTQQDKKYFIIQNNWGNQGNHIGRIPVDKFIEVYVPVFEGQASLEEYMKHQGADINRKYELIFV